MLIVEKGKPWQTKAFSLVIATSLAHFGNGIDSMHQAKFCASALSNVVILFAILCFLVCIISPKFVKVRVLWS